MLIIWKWQDVKLFKIFINFQRLLYRFSFIVLLLNINCLYAYTSYKNDRNSTNNSVSYAPNVELNLKKGNKRDIARTGLLLPILQNENNIFFLTLFGMLDSAHAAEGNFGLGYRKRNNNLIYGAYSYYDLRKTPSNNKVNQLTLGTEVLHANYEFRFNFYLPNKKNYTIKSTEKYTANRHLQKIVLTENRTFEKALNGFDVEAGVHVPHLNKMRIFSGYFRFFGKNVDPVNGYRFRADYQIFPWLAIEGEFSHDNARGDMGYGGIRLNWHIGNMKDYDKKSTIYHKMTQLPVRDVDIITRVESKTTEVNVDGVTLKPEDTLLGEDEADNIKAELMLGDSEFGHTMNDTEGDLYIGISKTLEFNKNQLLLFSKRDIIFLDKSKIIVRGNGKLTLVANNGTLKFPTKMQTSIKLYDNGKLNVFHYPFSNGKIQLDPTENRIKLIVKENRVPEFKSYILVSSLDEIRQSLKATYNEDLKYSDVNLCLKSDIGGNSINDRKEHYPFDQKYMGVFLFNGYAIKHVYLKSANVNNHASHEIRGLNHRALFTETDNAKFVDIKLEDIIHEKIPYTNQDKRSDYSLLVMSAAHTDFVNPIIKNSDLYIPANGTSVGILAGRTRGCRFFNLDVNNVKIQRADDQEQYDDVFIGFASGFDTYSEFFGDVTIESVKVTTGNGERGQDKQPELKNHIGLFGSNKSRADTDATTTNHDTVRSAFASGTSGKYNTEVNLNSLTAKDNLLKLHGGDYVGWVFGYSENVPVKIDKIDIASESNKFTGNANIGYISGQAKYAESIASKLEEDKSNVKVFYNGSITNIRNYSELNDKSLSVINGNREKVKGISITTEGVKEFGESKKGFSKKLLQPTLGHDEITSESKSVHDKIVTIQSFWRGAIGRKQARELKERQRELHIVRQRSATKIQAAYRGYAVRANVTRRNRPIARVRRAIGYVVKPIVHTVANYKTASVIAAIAVGSGYLYLNGNLNGVAAGGAAVLAGGAPAGGAVQNIVGSAVVEGAPAAGVGAALAGGGATVVGAEDGLIRGVVPAGAGNDLVVGVAPAAIPAAVNGSWFKTAVVGGLGGGAIVALRYLRK